MNEIPNRANVIIELLGERKGFTYQAAMLKHILELSSVVGALINGIANARSDFLAVIGLGESAENSLHGSRLRCSSCMLPIRSYN